MPVILNTSILTLDCITSIANALSKNIDEMETIIPDTDLALIKGMFEAVTAAFEQRFPDVPVSDHIVIPINF